MKVLVRGGKKHMNATISVAIEPLIRKKIFNTEEEAIRELTREYILRQIAALRRQIGRFERKHGMRFQQFSDYLHERSVLLEKVSFQQNSVRRWAKPLCKKRMSGWTGSLLRK